MAASATAYIIWLKLLTLLCAIATVPIQAELSPDAYAELKTEAAEVLSVNVTDVTNVTAGATEGDNCTLYFAVDAVVLNAERSTVGYSYNDNIKFEAFTRDRSIAECELFIGPGAPDLLEDGWCGLVYLNPPEEGADLLQPAAFGQSFENYTAEECEAAAQDGASQPAPTSGSASIYAMYWMNFISAFISVINVFGS